MRQSDWLKIRLQKAQNTVRLLKKDIQIEELTTELENTVEQLSRTQKGFCSDIRGMQDEYSRRIAELERDNKELRERNDNQRIAMEWLLPEVERLQKELETKPIGVLRSESVLEEFHPELILTPRKDRDLEFMLLLDFEENTPENPKGWESV
jgi:predicted RNase H-like nuclease (RuvC/YqgF family)